MTQSPPVVRAAAAAPATATAKPTTNQPNLPDSSTSVLSAQIGKLDFAAADIERAVLSAAHLRMLEVDSSLSQHVIAARGYYTLTAGNGTADSLQALGFSYKQARDTAHGDVLVLPIRPPDGSGGLCMIRPDVPRVFDGKKLDDGTHEQKVLKYEQPEGAANRLDVNPLCLAQLADPGVDVWITEGVKKGDALASAGLCAVALPGGVWGFMGRNDKGSSTVVADLDYIAWKDKASGTARNVWIVFDSDVIGKDAVRKALHRLTAILRNKGAQVYPVYLPSKSDGSKQGVDDFFAGGGTVDLLRAYGGNSKLAVQMEQGTTPRMKTADYVELIQSLGYEARFNTLSQTLEINGASISDVTEARLKSHLRDHGVDAVNVAMEALLGWAGTARAYHPIRDTLDGLTWDGKDHIWRLASYFKDVHVDLFPEGDWRRKLSGPAFGTFLCYWLVNAVARIYQPGTVRTTMLVLASRQQSIGKSKFVQWLADPFPGYFNDSAINPDDKDHALRAASNFVWEVSELEATTTRKDVGALKSFITRQTVKERRAYGKHDLVLPTMANFIGTVNVETNRGFLVDRTGSSRFMVVELESIDWRSYTQAVDPAQVWAQAVALFRQGKPAELEGFDLALSRKINHEHESTPSASDFVAEIVQVTDQEDDTLTTPRIVERMREKGYPVGNTTARDIGIYLSSIGVESQRRRVNGQKATVYLRVVLL